MKRIYIPEYQGRSYRVPKIKMGAMSKPRACQAEPRAAKNKALTKIIDYGDCRGGSCVLMAGCTGCQVFRRYKEDGLSMQRQNNCGSLSTPSSQYIFNIAKRKLTKLLDLHAPPPYLPTWLVNTRHLGKLRTIQIISR